MACHKEPPFTAEQVAWIDQRIAETLQTHEGNAIERTKRALARSAGRLAELRSQ